MANKNFVVHNGLTVGSLTIDAATGDINTPGNVNISGSVGVSSIAKNDSSISITDTGSGSNVRIIVDGEVEHTINSEGSTIVGNVTTGNVVFTNTLSQGNASYRMNQYVLYGNTTDDTETELFVNNQANVRVPIKSNVAISYQISVTSRNTADGGASGWELKGVAHNVAGTVSDVGDLYYISIAQSNANLEVDARADDTTNSLNIYCTGVTGQNINWLALVKTVEVVG